MPFVLISLLLDVWSDNLLLAVAVLLREMIALLEKAKVSAGTDADAAKSINELVIIVRQRRLLLPFLTLLDGG